MPLWLYQSVEKVFLRVALRVFMYPSWVPLYPSATTMCSRVPLLRDHMRVSLVPLCALLSVCHSCPRVPLRLPVCVSFVLVCLIKACSVLVQVLFEIIIEKYNFFESMARPYRCSVCRGLRSGVAGPVPPVRAPVSVALCVPLLFLRVPFLLFKCA